MTVLYSRKQATLKQQQQEREREKRGGEEEKEKLVDGEEDSRSKSFSTLLYEDKVHTRHPAVVLKSYHDSEVTVVCTSKSYTNLSKRASLEIYAVSIMQ